MSKPKPARDIPLYVRVSQAEYDLIQERMAEAGTNNMAAFVRKMALNGYVLHVDLAPVKDLVSLQRRCSNNLNQIAVSVNTYGGIYPQEFVGFTKGLCRAVGAALGFAQTACGDCKDVKNGAWRRCAVMPRFSIKSVFHSFK